MTSFSSIHQTFEAGDEGKCSYFDGPEPGYTCAHAACVCTQDECDMARAWALDAGCHLDH